jgi:hypothetical protein
MNNELPFNARLLANYVDYCSVISRVIERQDYYVVSISDPEAGSLAVTVSARDMARFVREQAVRRIDAEFMSLQNKLANAQHIIDQDINNAQDKRRSDDSSLTQDN